MAARMMSMRSPGVMIRAPSSMYSRKWVMSVAVEDLGVQPLDHVVDGRVAQPLVVRDGVGQKRVRGARPGLDVPQGLGGEVRAGAVDDQPQDLQAAFLEDAHRALGRAAYLLVGPVHAVDHDEHRTAQVGDDARVDLELQGGVAADVVRALAEHEVVLLFQLLELVQGALQEQFLVPAVDQPAGLAQGVAVGLVILLVELEVAEHEVDVVVPAAVHRIADDRAEHGHALEVGAQQVHDPEDDGGLPASGFGGGYVEAF
jgi:hypothetical protein